MNRPGARFVVSAAVAVAATAALLPLAGPVHADGPRLRKIGTFDEPVFLTAPDRKRLFVVEKSGRIMVVKGGRTLRTPLLDLRGRVSGGSEQGLFSMALPPDHRRTRRFYVNYTNNSGDTRIAEFRTKKGNPNRAIRGTGRTVLAIDQPYENHNGGQLQFGPDGLLYIGTGDGGSGGDPENRAQDLGSLLGKMLRINPRKRGSAPYTVPRSNPFVGRPGARPEVYSYGLRNPWRFSFDRATGDLTIADVGQGEWEEIDHAARGAARGVNYGWRVFEGSHLYTGESAPNAVPPVLEMWHGDGWCAVAGGYVVRDRSSSLYGRYLYGDYCADRIHSAVLTPGGARGNRGTSLRVGSLSSFGEDARGRVYALSLAGPVYRIVG